MDLLWTELTRGMTDSRHFAQILLRLLAAILLGGIVGMEREHEGKPAGLRTHILVCLGTVTFILACSQSSITSDSLSRVIQGIAAGIGFIGAGSILKISEKQDVHGLTTAAGIWMTAAIGVSIGLGHLGIALLCTFFTFSILSFARRLEHRRREMEQQKAETTNAKSALDRSP